MPCFPVTIPFALPEATRVNAAIFSITGQRVRELHDGWLPAGSHRLRWDGRDDGGMAVSSGLYLVRVTGGGSVAARKMVLVK